MKYLFRHPVSWIAIVIAAAAGCADPGDSAGEGRAGAAIVSPYIGQQGRLLLGFKNPDTRIFSFASLPATRVVSDGQLVAGAIAGTGFTGVKFTATDGLTTVDMRIAQVIPPASPGLKWEYVLEQLQGGSWQPACETPTPIVPPADPVDDPPHAIAMPGYWFGAFYFVQSTYVTFACKTGVVAKCDGWGFPVTTTWPHVTKNGTPTNATGADVMQACSRMARADYCANGMPNTLDGTPIQIDDVFTAEAPPPMPGYAFEAAWAGKAINDSRPTPLPVVCLSKLRWSTLPLGGDCPLVVSDPRVNDKAKFCDDLSPLDLERAGALVYSASTFIDAGLYTYFDPGSELRLTTANLLPQKVGDPPKWQIPPPSGVDFPLPGQSTQFEATIFPAALPPQVPANGLDKLFSYRCETDLRTTTTHLDDPTCTQIAMEGYVYPRNTVDRAPLRRWFNPSIKHSYTTAISPTTMMAAGWNLAEVVGGVLRAAIDVNVRWSSLAGYSYTLDVQTRAGGWITSCVDSAHIGTTPKFAYHGTCVGAGNYPLNHADIIAFRVTYTRPGLPTYVATRAYDGFSSDAYVALPGGVPTALAVHWNDLGPDTAYAVDLRNTSGTWLRCAAPQQLADDVSYVHTGKCWSGAGNLQVSKILQVRVCIFDRSGEDERKCSEPIDFDGKSPSIDIPLKI